MLNSKIRRLLLENECQIIGMRKSVYFLQKAWKNLPNTTLNNTWDQYL